MIADVYLPTWGDPPRVSPGLAQHAQVLQHYLGEEQINIIHVHQNAYYREKSDNDRSLGAQRKADTAIFLERVFESSEIHSYDRRVLIVNPEWLLKIDADRISRGCVSEVWHTSKLSMELLAPLFQDQRHVYLGFTSLNKFEGAEPNFSSFGHFAGKATERRHTQELINIWVNNPRLPVLSAHWQQSPHFPKWLQSENLRVGMGFLGGPEFYSEVSRHGIQLCTSSTEAFGHYINEARSLGAVVVTLDAPPMNELVDEESGVMVAFSKSGPLNYGSFFKSTEDQLLQAIDKVLSLSLEERAALGKRARERYFSEQLAFRSRLTGLLKA